MRTNACKKGRREKSQDHYTQHATQRENSSAPCQGPPCPASPFPPHLTFTATIRHSKLNHTIPFSPSGSFHLSPGDQPALLRHSPTRAFLLPNSLPFLSSFNLAGSSSPSSVDPLESYDRWREPGATGSSVWVTLPIRWARLVSSCPSFLAFCFRTSPVALPFCDVLVHGNC